MKKASYYLSLIFVMTLAIFTSCKDDDNGGTTDPTQEEIKTEQLTSSPFTVDVLEMDGEDALDGQNITLDFQESGSYSITGGTLPDPAPFGTTMPASGTWAFSDTDNFNRITLTSGGTSVELNVTVLNDDELVFQYAGAGVKEDSPNTTVVVEASR